MTLKEHGVVPIKIIEFYDHYVYSEESLAFLVTSNEILLMTEKDSLKCLDFIHNN